MSIIVIIQSRMTSYRFPGKMLAPLMGKPLLYHVVQKIKDTNLNFKKIILATSKDNADDPLASYARSLGLKIVRGSRDNVMKRYKLALNEHKCQAFFRVCGDSPLILPSLFKEAKKIFDMHRYDLITNVHPRTFPTGMSIELFKTKTFLHIEKIVRANKYREHIAQYFYNNSKNFKIYNIKCARPKSNILHLAIDNPKDLRKIKKWCSKNSNELKKIFPIKNKYI